MPIDRAREASAARGGRNAPRRSVRTRALVLAALSALPCAAAFAGGALVPSTEISAASATTLAPYPAPLVRSRLSGAFVYRTALARPDVEGCRWPDAPVLEAVLAIATEGGSRASGVVLAPDRVLTAAHALVEGGRAFVRIGGDFRRAEPLLIDRANDIAVLGVDTRGIAPLPLAERAPGERQRVWAVGFPRNEGRTTSSGVFQRERDGALHTSASIEAGQSGGGLLVCEGGRYRLGGMLRGFGAYREGDAYIRLENHSVSVASTTLQRVLAADL